jgi:hypothetical protein
MMFIIIEKVIFVRVAVFEEVGNTLGHYHSAPWLLRYTFIQAELLFFLRVSFLSKPKYRSP